MWIHRILPVRSVCEKSRRFEVLVDAAQLVTLKSELEKVIDIAQDSVRFYRLGNTYESRIETMGKRPLVEAGKALIF